MTKVSGNIVQLKVSGNMVQGGSAFSWAAFWASLISATVEQAAPTKIVMTFSQANTSLLATDFTIAGKTITLLERDITNKILTLTVNVAVLYGDSLTITFVKTGGTAAVTNNVAAEAETIIQKDRIEADGGVVVDLTWMNSVIRTLKEQGIYSNCKLLTDANFGVKKDGAEAVSKLYDVSGNNNDAIQTTGANQPIWSLSGGKGIITYNGTKSLINSTFPIMLLSSGATLLNRVYWNGTHSANGDMPIIVGSDVFKKRIVYITSDGKLGVSNWGNDVFSGVEFSSAKNCTIAGVFNADKSVIGYINNVSKVTGSLAETADTTSGLYIGGITGYFFNGQINSSTVFNIVLTPIQLTTLYDLGL